MSKKRFRLIIAVITIAAFLSTSAAAGPAPVRTPPGQFDVSSIFLPAALGEVSSVFSGTNGRTILHIQDAHCNYNAQHAIADIVSNLSAGYKCDLVFLEGGMGPYDFSVFDRVRDPGIREKVSDYFVKEGIVAGAEFFAINNPGRVELFGIEDETLYFKNLKAYRDSLAFKSRADSYIRTLTAAMNNLKLKAYTPALKELDLKVSARRDHRINFKTYAFFLKEKIEAANIAVADYKNLDILFNTMRIEDAVNLKDAEIECDILVDKIGSVLSKAQIEELRKRVAEYKAREIASEAFYGYLFKKAKLASADIKTMPSLVKYAQYLRAYESIDKSALLKEVGSAEEALADRLAKSEDQKKIYRLDKDLNILRAIFDTSLIKEDFDYYRAHRGDFDVRNFTDFFIKRGPVYGLSFTPDERLNALDGFRAEAVNFYEYSLKRDDVFLKNIEAKLAADKKNVAILVTGGFHSQNLFKLFKGKGYSYAKIMPKFAVEAGENPYFGLLAGGTTPTQRFLKIAASYTPEKTMLAIETPFSKMAVSEFTKNLITLQIELVEKITRGEIFVIQTPQGFISISSQPIEAYIQVLESDGLTFYANFSPTPPVNPVNAVVLDKENMRWEPGKGIIEEAPGEGPQAAGTKGAAAAVKYSQVVSVIRGVVGVGVGPQYAGERLIKKDETEKDVGVIGAPFRVVLKTSTAPSGQVYIEAPQPEGGLVDWGAGMIEFDKTVLKSLAERPLAPEREYKVYIEHPAKKGSKLRTLATFEKLGLDETVAMQRVGNITFIMFTPEDRERIFNEIADAPANISIATFALKAKEESRPEQDLRGRMENKSYTVYMELKSDNNYVPVRTCGMTALKIFDYQHIQRQIEQNIPVSISDQNQAVELVARGIGLLCGASQADVIGLIARMDDAGRMELLKSGLILVAIRPVDISEIRKLNEMAKLVREAV